MLHFKCELINQLTSKNADLPSSPHLTPNMFFQIDFNQQINE